MTRGSGYVILVLPGGPSSQTGSAPTAEASGSARITASRGPSTSRPGRTSPSALWARRWIQGCRPTRHSPCSSESGREEGPGCIDSSPRRGTCVDPVSFSYPGPAFSRFIAVAGETPSGSRIGGSATASSSKALMGSAISSDPRTVVIGSSARSVGSGRAEVALRVARVRVGLISSF
jgi:hypothetical protein